MGVVLVCQACTATTSSTAPTGTGAPDASTATNQGPKDASEDAVPSSMDVQPAATPDAGSDAALVVAPEAAAPESEAGATPDAGGP